MISLIRTSQFVKEIEKVNETVKILVSAETSEADVAIDAHFESFSELLLFMYRCVPNSESAVKFCSFWNDDNRLMSLQLCMTKTNNLTLDVSIDEILSVSGQLFYMKLTNLFTEQSSDSSEKLNNYFTAYEKLRKSSHAVDLLDILFYLKQFISKLPLKLTVFYTDEPQNKFERLILTFLTYFQGCDLDEEPLNVASLCRNLQTPLCTYFKQLSKIMLAWSPVQKSPTSSVVLRTPKMDVPLAFKVHLNKTFLSFFTLLINSRDSIATARALMSVSSDCFTALRKVSEQTQMPMTLVAVSFVMRLRLGNKEKNPGSELLSPHAKTLSSFVDVLHKLQSIVEDNNDHVVCFEKLCCVIRRRILDSCDGMKYMDILNAVQQRLLALLKDILAVCQKNENFSQSPTKKPEKGATIVGRRRLRVLQLVIDLETCRQQSTVSPCEFLEDYESSPSSTMQFPSLKSLFRTPELKPLPVKPGLQERDQNLSKEPSLTSFLILNNGFRRDTPPGAAKVPCTMFVDEAKENKENIPPGAVVLLTPSHSSRQQGATERVRPKPYRNQEPKTPKRKKSGALNSLKRKLESDEKAEVTKSNQQKRRTVCLAPSNNQSAEALNLVDTMSLEPRKHQKAVPVQKTTTKTKPVAKMIVKSLSNNQSTLLNFFQVVSR